MVLLEDTYIRYIHTHRISKFLCFGFKEQSRKIYFFATEKYQLWGESKKLNRNGRVKKAIVRSKRHKFEKVLS